MQKLYDYCTGHWPHLITWPIQNLFPLHLGHVHPPPPPSLQLITRLHTCQAPWPVCSWAVLGGSWEKEGDQRVTFCGGNGLSKELNQHRWVAPLPLSTRHTQRAQKMSSRWLELENNEIFRSNSHIFIPILLATGSQSRGWRHVGVPVENTRRQIIWGYWQESYWAMSVLGSLLWI